ncbi:MAG: hypothetical protein JOY83_19625 [Alphaproteobacteria bacterium]|nr:hypothetical protein [Alphaproteobacteria bacterium]
MERKAAASAEGLSGSNAGRASEILSHLRWPLSRKGSLLAVAIAALIGIFGFTAVHETTRTSREPAVASRPAVPPPKPAFTRPEEAYIQALWPIHGEVERNAVRLSLGRIFYKVDDIGKAELKTRLEAELAAFRHAEERIQALQPPPSLAGSHGEYLAAVRLFQQSAIETLKMFEDGDDGHLLAAYPASREGSDKIREIGVKFWEDEFPPH